MASVNLIDLLSVGCDIELQFEDGTMPANSGALRVFSSVIDHALDAQECQTPAKARKASASSTPATASTDERTIIPLPGVTKEQWLRVAEFLYPVVPSPKIEDWQEAEFLLEVGGLLPHSCGECIPCLGTAPERIRQQLCMTMLLGGAF